MDHQSITVFFYQFIRTLCVPLHKKRGEQNAGYKAGQIKSHNMPVRFSEPVRYWPQEGEIPFFSFKGCNKFKNKSSLLEPTGGPQFFL